MLKVLDCLKNIYFTPFYINHLLPQWIDGLNPSAIPWIIQTKERLWTKLQFIFVSIDRFKPIQNSTFYITLTSAIIFITVRLVPNIVIYIRFYYVKPVNTAFLYFFSLYIIFVSYVFIINYYITRDHIYCQWKSYY